MCSSKPIQGIMNANKNTHSRLLRKNMILNKEIKTIEDF